MTTTNPLDKLTGEHIAAIRDLILGLDADADETADRFMELPDLPAGSNRQRVVRDQAWSELERLRHNMAVTERRIAEILAAAEGLTLATATPGKGPLTAGDVYAAGLAVGRILADRKVDPDTAREICDVIRALEARGADDAART